MRLTRHRRLEFPDVCCFEILLNYPTAELRCGSMRTRIALRFFLSTTVCALLYPSPLSAQLSKRLNRCLPYSTFAQEAWVRRFWPKAWQNCEAAIWDFGWTMCWK